MGQAKTRKKEIGALQISAEMHEAGHAVVAYFLGRLGSGGIQMLSPDDETLGSTAVAEQGEAVDTLAIALAGPMAELRSVARSVGAACDLALVKPTAELGWTDDAKAAAGVLGLKWGIDAMSSFCRAVRRGVADDLLLLESIDKASTLLAERWPAVESVGQTLRSVRVLTADHIIELIAGAADTR